MCPDALDYSVVLVGQDDIALRVQFQNEVVAELVWAKREDDDSLHAYLSYGFQPLRPKELPKLNTIWQTFIVKPDGILFFSAFASVVWNLMPF